MIPGIQYSLGVEKDGVYIRYVNRHNVPYSKHLRRKMTSMNDLIAFLHKRAKKFKVNSEDFIIMGSSSLDFPHEYTKRKKVIALANELR